MSRKRIDIYTSTCYVRKYHLFCHTYYIYGLEKAVIKKSNYIIGTYDRELNKKTVKFLPIIDALTHLEGFDLYDYSVHLHLERHETYNFIREILHRGQNNDRNIYVKKLTSLIENSTYELRFKYNLELKYDTEVIKENQRFMEEVKRNRDIILLYTDGSYKLDQTVGTWSYSYYENGEHSCGPVGNYIIEDLDNNYFELYAVIEGLKHIYRNIYTYNKNVCIILKTDSKFVIEALRESRENNIKYGKKDYLNDIKSKFRNVVNEFKCPIIVRHVQSHSDNIRNILVDKECKSLYPDNTSS